MDSSVRYSTIPCTEKGKINFTIDFKFHFSSVLTSISKHSLFLVKAAFANHGINILALLGNSLDLNPIENLCSIMGKKITENRSQKKMRTSRKNK